METPGNVRRWNSVKIPSRQGDTKRARYRTTRGGAEKLGVDTPGNESGRDIAKRRKHQAMKGEETPGGHKNTKKTRCENIKKVRRGDMRLI